MAVISVGAGNRYRHPAPETLARLERAGIRVYRTDLDGTITIDTDGQRLEVRAGAPPQRPDSGVGAPLLAMKATETLAFVDAIEDGVARLLVGETAFDLPRALLPREAVEGSWVKIGIAVIPPPGEDDTEARRRALGEEDPGGDIAL